jgi:hypothetical protein
MNNKIIQFLNDFIVTPYSNDMHDKYWRSLPEISIKETLQYILQNKLETKLISTNFYGDFRDRQGPYLLKTESGKFEVFESERGFKHGLKTYFLLEDALFHFLDKIFNSYAMAATDSIINS